MSWAGFKKNVNRATTQVMLKTGHVEKTNDRDYEVEERYGHIRTPAHESMADVTFGMNTAASGLWKQHPYDCKKRPRATWTLYEVRNDHFPVTTIRSPTF